MVTSLWQSPGQETLDLDSDALILGSVRAVYSEAVMLSWFQSNSPGLTQKVLEGRVLTVLLSW